MANFFKAFLIWALGSGIAIFFALNVLPAAFDGAHYIPVGNDSFYHAHRILGAVANPASYYEFDSKIHAPEGSLLTWPWAYDLSVAHLVRAALALGIGTDPVKLMDYVPVAALPVAMALILSIVIQLRLSAVSQAIAVLAVALSPLTQFLFGVGLIDHHYVEYLFVLASLSAGLFWLRDPEAIWKAALLGALLGVSPAFQNGLFIVQIPVLVAFGVYWLQNRRMPFKAVTLFAAALVGVTLLALLPSQPFRQGEFAYYLFSWFHLYVAGCSALMAILLARLPRSPQAGAVLCGVALVLLLPIAGQALLGGTYFASRVESAYQITEVRSVVALIGAEGWSTALRYYSALLLTVPAVLIGCLWYLIKRAENRAVSLLCVYSVFGLVLLLLKFRFHNFGSFALFVPALMAVDAFASANASRRTAVFGVTAAAFCAAFALPLSSQLFARQWPANDIYYGLTKDIFPAMQAACAARPGILLARNNDGHYVSYHTDCAVIADNFMLTRQHVAKLKEMERLLALSPAQLLQEKSPPKYVYARLDSIVTFDAKGKPVIATAEEARRLNPALFDALLFSPPETLNPRFKLIKELRWPGADGYPYARLLEIQ